MRSISLILSFCLFFSHAMAKSNDTASACEEGKAEVEITNSSSHTLTFTDEKEGFEATVAPNSNETICIKHGDFIDSYIQQENGQSKKEKIHHLWVDAKHMKFHVGENGNYRVHINKHVLQKKDSLADLKCDEKESVVIINNLSKGVMGFTDVNKKIDILLEPDSDTAICLHQGDIIDGVVRYGDKEGEKLSVHQIWWTTKKMQVDVDKEGHITVHLETSR